MCSLFTVLRFTVFTSQRCAETKNNTRTIEIHRYVKFTHQCTRRLWSSPRNIGTHAYDCVDWLWVCFSFIYYFVVVYSLHALGIIAPLVLFSVWLSAYFHLPVSHSWYVFALFSDFLSFALACAYAIARAVILPLYLMLFETFRTYERDISHSTRTSRSFIRPFVRSFVRPMHLNVCVE